jgi:hypothetical protein
MFWNSLVSCFAFRWGCGSKIASFFCIGIFFGPLTVFAIEPVTWNSTVVLNAIPNFEDNGTDARHIRPGKFGSQYGRMTKLADGSWLVVYTIYDNSGYKYGDAHHVSWQGTTLQIAKSTDNCRTWKVLSTLRGNNRDLDNGQIIQLPNGHLLMAGRSVRWQESYFICVWSSGDGGLVWRLLSEPDKNEGSPGSLGNPDKGMYEPHFCLLDDGSLALFYANEKHVVENPSYSQIISERLSHDEGKTWGPEKWVAWDPRKPSDRPGMPVITKMANGQYLVVFEVVGSHSAGIFCKTSGDGKTWNAGIGNAIPGQAGGPYVISLTDGRIIVTSNTGNVSLSDNYGGTWHLNSTPAWGDGTINKYWWLSVYQTAPQEIGVVASVPRATGGTDVRIKFGTLSPLLSKSD